MDPFQLHNAGHHGEVVKMALEIAKILGHAQAQLQPSIAGGAMQPLGPSHGLLAGSGRHRLLELRESVAPVEELPREHHAHQNVSDETVVQCPRFQASVQRQ